MDNHCAKNFHRQRIFPIACLVAIVDALFNSWIAQIPNTSWCYIVGGVTFVCLCVAAVGSILASSEADWQSLMK